MQIPAGQNPGTAPQADSTKWPDLGDTASSTQHKPRRNEAGLIVADTDNSVPALGGLTIRATALGGIVLLGVGIAIAAGLM